MVSGVAVRRDVGHWIVPAQVGIVGLAVVSQISVVNEGQQAQTGGIALDGVGGIVELEIVGADVVDVVVETSVAGEFGQQRLSKAKAYLGALVVCHRGQGKAVRVTGNFVDTVVPDGKIGELQVSVAADFVHVEKVEQAHLAEGELEPAPRDGRLQVKRVWVFVDAIGSEGYGLMDKGTREVNGASHLGISSIGVDVGSQAEAVTQTAATGLVEIGDELSKAQDAHTGVEGNGAGNYCLPIGTKAIRPGVGRRERLVRLQDEVRLAGYPKAVVDKVVEKKAGLS